MHDCFRQIGACQVGKKRLVADGVVVTRLIFD